VVLPGDGKPADNTITGLDIVIKPSPVVNLAVGNTNLVLNFSTPIGATGSIDPGSTASFTNGTPYPINDNSVTSFDTTVSPIVVPFVGGGNLASNLRKVIVNLTHTFDGDVDMYLISPSGQRIELSTDNGGGGENFISTTFVPFGTPGAIAITSGSAPFTGDFTPEENFTTFTGTAQGTWKLVIKDDAGGDFGTLLNWTIQFDNQLISGQWTSSPAFTGFPYNAPSPTSNLNWSSPTITYNTLPGGSFNFTLTVADAAGCNIAKDTAINWFTTNEWLGIIDGPNSWTDPLNWQASPAPPTSTQAVTVRPVGVTPLLAAGPILFPPKMNGTSPVGTITSKAGSDIQIGSGGKLQVSANWIGENGVTTGGGSVEFAGSAVQSITGTSTFENITVNKTGGSVSLAGTANIIGTLGMASTAAPINIQPSGKLVLKSTATGTGRIGILPSGATINGNVTMERFVPWASPTVNGSWFFIGSPIVGKDFKDWADDFRVSGPLTGFGAQGAPVLASSEIERTTIFEYNQTLHNVSPDTVQKVGWRAPANGNITLGKGYRTFINRYSLGGNPAFENTGTVNIGLVNFPVLTRNEFANCNSYTTASNAVPCVEDNRGWNLLSNPYPAPLNWNASGAGTWTKPLQMNNAFYTYNAASGNYQVFLGGGGSSTLGVRGGANPNLIPSSQAFFVKLTTAGTYSAPLSVNESAKDVSASGQFTREATSTFEQIRIRLAMTGNTSYEYDGVLRFDQSATYGFDQHKDVHSIGGDNNFDFRMMSESGEGFLMNTVPLVNETKIIPMEIFYRGNSGLFTISFLETETVQNGAVVFLKDNFLGTLTSMNVSSDYNFTAINTDGSNNPHRFEIIITPGVTKANGLLGGAAFNVYPNPSNGGSKVTISVNGVNRAQGSIVVTDMLGKVVYTNTMNINEGSSSEKTIDLGLPSGVYTIKLISAERTFTDRLIVR
jgi:subtilisin-like proprotein convertase family protein